MHSKRLYLKNAVISLGGNMNKVFVLSFLLCMSLLAMYLFCCEPLVNRFEDVQDAQMYSAKEIQSVSTDVDTLNV